MDFLQSMTFQEMALGPVQAMKLMPSDVFHRSLLLRQAQIMICPIRL